MGLSDYEQVIDLCSMDIGKERRNWMMLNMNEIMKEDDDIINNN
jgi:hypothetical protein